MAVFFQCNIIFSGEKFDYFRKTNSCDLKIFFQKHPLQKSNDLVIRKAFHRADGARREWLSFYEEKNALFCTVCLAFSKNHQCLFVNGFNHRKHVHQRINEHESSQIHRECSSMLFSVKSNFHVANLIQKTFINKKKTLKSQKTAK